MLEKRNAVIFLTRRCPYSCRYCNSVKAIPSDCSKELSTEKWKEAVTILSNIGIRYNIFYGNESWYLGDDLLKIVRTTKVPYRVFSTAHPEVFSPLKNELFEKGLKSFACGIDYYRPEWVTGMNHTQAKSYYALTAFAHIRQAFPKVVCHAPCVVNSLNAHELLVLIRMMSVVLDVQMALNFVHVNTDGKFDMFPEPDDEKLEGMFLDTQYRFDMVNKVLDELFVMLHRRKVHNIEGLAPFLKVPMIFKKTGVTNDLWHCNGDPHGGPTVDSDGTLRLCPFRKGKEVAEMSVFDLSSKKHQNEWQRRVKTDSQRCPGCLMDIPRTYAHQQGAL